MKEYILNLMIEERNIVEEIIRIDNKVQFGNVTFDYLYNEITNIVIDNNYIGNKCIAITDGMFNSVFKILFNYSYDIECLNVDCRNIGFYMWLVDRINKYDENVNIILDTKNNYEEYKKYDYFLVCGVDTFVDFITNLYKKKSIIKFVN